MESCSQKIDLEYSNITVEDVLSNIDWIEETIKTLNISHSRITYNFLFHLGEIYCSAENKEEFIEDTYGEQEFSLVEVTIYLYNADEYECSFRFLTKLTVGTRSKFKLRNIISSLNENRQKAEEPKDTVVNHYHAPVVQGNNHGPIVNGDRNMVASDNANITTGDGNTIVAHSKKTKISTNSGSENTGILKTILLNVTSNFIYYVLGLGGTVLLAWMALK